MNLLQQASRDNIPLADHAHRPAGSRSTYWARRFLSFCAALLAVGALSLASSSPASADSPSCNDQFTCVFTGYNYTGAKRVIGAGEAGYWIPFDNAKYSLKNLFYNRRVWVSSTAGVYCLGPYTRYPGLAPTYYLWIDAPGSRC